MHLDLNEQRGEKGDNNMTDKNEDTGYIFVYGTLKVNTGPEAFARYFDKVRISSEDAKIQGKLYDFGYFPALIYGGNSTVYGELHKYKHFESVIELMDQIEGYIEPNNGENLYRRTVVTVTVKGGRTVNAITYEFAQPIERGTPSVVDGEWIMI